jgi:hypothetical protein
MENEYRDWCTSDLGDRPGMFIKEHSAPGILVYKTRRTKAVNNKKAV